MNIPKFPQKKESAKSEAGECVRLSNELRARQSYTDADGEFFSAVDGFDVETCDEIKLKEWLNSKSNKKSDSLISFVNRIYAWRFGDKHNQQSLALLQISNLEREMIHSSLKKELEFLGECGYHGKVRLDKSIILK